MYNERVDPRDRLSHHGARLFDVVADPAEQIDVSSVHAEEMGDLMTVARERLNELRLGYPAELYAASRPDSKCRMMVPITEEAGC